MDGTRGLDQMFKKYLESISRERGAIIPYCIINDKVYVALMKPSDPRYGTDSFQIAKGLRENNESIRQTAIREGEQELGLVIPKDIQLLWDNKKMGMTYFYVKVQHQTLHPLPNEDGIMETAEARWFNIEEAQNIIRSWQKPVIGMLRRRLGR